MGIAYVIILFPGYYLSHIYFFFHGPLPQLLILFPGYGDRKDRLANQKGRKLASCNRGPLIAAV